MKTKALRHKVKAISNIQGLSVKTLDIPHSHWFYCVASHSVKIPYDIYFVKG